MPAALYVVFFIIYHLKAKGREIYYNSVFRLYVLLFGIYLFIIWTTGSSFVLPIILPYVFLFLASSISLMRFVRYEPQVQAGISAKLISTIPILAVFIGAALLASAWFRAALGWVYQNIFVVFFGGIITIVRFVLDPIMYWIFGLVEEIEIQQQGEEPENGEHLSNILYETEFARGDTRFMQVVFVICLILFAALIVYITIYLVSAYAAQMVKEGLDQDYVPLDVEKKKSVKPKNKMRRAYIRFLSKCRRKGILKSAYNSSADYENLAIERFGKEEDLKAFRKMYLPVRYGDEEKDVTPQDLEFAKKVVSRLGK